MPMGMNSDLCQDNSRYCHKKFTSWIYHRSGPLRDPFVPAETQQENPLLEVGAVGLRRHSTVREVGRKGRGESNLLQAGNGFVLLQSPDGSSPPIR